MKMQKVVRARGTDRRTQINDATTIRQAAVVTGVVCESPWPAATTEVEDYCKACAATLKVRKKAGGVSRASGENAMLRRCCDSNSLRAGQ